MKGGSIQDNLYLIREVLEGIEDGTEAALISLDQSKAFDRVDHRFLASVLETVGFQPEFRKWICMMYHNPLAVVQVNRRRSRAFAIERSVRQGCPLSPLLYVLALAPLIRRLRDEGANPALRGVPFAGPLAARVSAVFANGPGDLGSIPGRVIPKTQKMVLDASLLNTQHYKVRIKGKVEQSREGVAPSPTPWCSSYRKGSLRVTLDYGRQLYLYPAAWI